MSTNKKPNKGSNKEANKSPKKIYYIKGMHCASCEVLIRQGLLSLPGIQDVKVSLAKKQVVVNLNASGDTTGTFPTITSLNQQFKDLGYTFHETFEKEKSLSKKDSFKVVSVFLLFIVLFYLLERSPILMRVSLTSGSSLVTYFLFGLAAGISSCAALVGGILLSLSKKWNVLYNSNTKKSSVPFIYFNSSRIISFAVLGGVLGYIGSLFAVSIEATAVLTITICLLMLVLGFQMLGVTLFHKLNVGFLSLWNNSPGISTKLSKLTESQELYGKYLPITVGILTFFIPCGFTLIAQSMALTSGGFKEGFLNLLAFSLGTLPVLALISFSSVKLHANPNFSKKFSLFSGLLIIFFALYTANSQLNVLGVTSLSDLSKITNRIDPYESYENKILPQNTDYQVMQMEVIGFDYYPKQFTIRSGVKTKWEIYDSGSIGCARAVYGRGLYSEVIYLQPGMNEVEFTAPEPGTYKISCSMGMVSPITVKVL